MGRTDEVLDYWLETVGPDGWFVAVPEVDAEITRRFRGLWQEVADGGLIQWHKDARACLAYLIVADQFPRNMFRGDPRSFATDAAARDAARDAIARGLDLAAGEPERAFFYLPFEHSENPADQDWSVALMTARLTSDPGHALHARAHREIIRRFGRFPYRNGALGRTSSPAETEFMAAGGYGAIVRELGG
ncbi:MAG: DUF924 domain-containing protein [Proteobacteria bacterium]|nr:DUF924 domain-containing protein [Pseudomonadota bacterium]MBS0571966.1 DUF924 domain-containing protein [Pseudomonadota bacterium]